MSTATTTTPEGSTPVKPRRRTGAFRCFPGSSHSRVQGLVAQHFPILWGEVSVKWLPTARPIDPFNLEQTGDYARDTLADILISFGDRGLEWDGFEICHTLREHRGWQCDFHLAAIIHAWSRGVADKLHA